MVLTVPGLEFVESLPLAVSPESLLLAVPLSPSTGSGGPREAEGAGVSSSSSAAPVPPLAQLSNATSIGWSSCICVSVNTYSN